MMFFGQFREFIIIEVAGYISAFNSQTVMGYHTTALIHLDRRISDQREKAQF